MFSLLTQGLRSWKNSKSIAFLCIAALAIGIGSTTAIYTVIQAVLLNPLPYSHPDRYFFVFRAWHTNPDRLTEYSYPAAMETAERVRSTDAFGCVNTFGYGYNVSFQGQPLHVQGSQVSAPLLQSLGVNPAMGRWFNDGAREPNGTHVVVLSDSLWRRWGSDPQILGKGVTLNNEAYVVVGVTSPGFKFPEWEGENWLWVPLDEDENGKTNRGFEHLLCIAKLKAGVSAQVADADFKDIQAQLAREYPTPEEPDTTRLDPVLQRVVEDIRPVLLLLLGAAGVVLLITCANVASVLLTRSVARARETALRLSLGASGWQLGWQYFAEGLVVAVAGGVAGAAGSYALVRAAVALAADDIPRADQIHLNGQALAFALGTAILCAVLCSLAPLWQARRAELNEVLSDGSRSSAGARSRGFLRILVVTEIALAFGLVAAGAVFLQQLGNLYRTRLGFDPDHLLAVSMAAPGKYSDQALEAYQSRLAESIRALPGVESAGFAYSLPLTGVSSADGIWIDGDPRPDFTKTASIGQNFVSTGYFETMRIPLLAGRYFTAGDKDEGEKGISPLILNQAAARRFFGARNPLDVTVHTTSLDRRLLRIVGVVGDYRNTRLGQTPRPEIYYANRELPFPQMQWAIRSPLDSAVLIRQVRQAVAGVDSEQPIFGERTMSEVITGSIGRERLQSLMVSFFAASALLLALLGIYGVVSYSVRQRTTEIGTRLALGATARDVIGMVVGDGMKMAAAGVALGLIAVLALAREAASFDLGVQASSLTPFLIATALTVTLTALACLVPGWHAATLSPLIAIRNEPDSMWQRARSEYRRLAATVAELVSQPEERPGEIELLSTIADVSRRAESFSEAIQLALAALRENMGTEFAVLLTAAAAGEAYRCTGASPETMRGANSEWTLPFDALLLNRLRYYSAALPLTSGDLETWSRWAAEQSPGHLAEMQMLQRMGAALAAPVASKSEMVGVLLLGPPVNRPPYSSSERRVLRGVGAQFALLVENARLTGRIVEQERLRRELALATEVQKRLFPEKLPQTAAIHCAGVCLPARGVGGDYYDFLDLGGGETGIALADVAGKGIAAALIMSVVQASLRSLAETNSGSLADLAARMNRLLHRSTGPNSYATFFYAQFDEAERKLRYVNAGHNPPFLLRRDGSIEELADGGAIIGMFPSLRYEEAAVELHSGDVLLAFSDGVPEAHDPAEEEFGEDRLKELLRGTVHLPVSEMSSRIMDGLQAWMADAEQYDDLTFIVVKVQ
ncbi:MAG TPA: ADOP family duplicated permease [Bryobacteraceae bacterium]|jgi:predicted permease